MFKCFFLALVGLLALAAGPVLAQQPAPGLSADAAAQPGPYCVLTGYTYNALGRMNFSLSYGEGAPKLPENQLFIEKQKVEAFRTTADALNYLATKGWELVTGTVVFGEGTYVREYVLRKRAGN